MPPTAEELACEVELGRNVTDKAPVKWYISTKGNPHLMIVGLQGMGKTTCLVNVCRQLRHAGIGQSYFPIIRT
jgi:DNA phosphorothioation-dependent restriction protein DptH